MAYQEQDRRNRQAAAVMDRISTTQQEGESRYMGQQATQRQAERRRAALQAAPPEVFPISSLTDTPMTPQQVEQYDRDFFGQAFSGTNRYGHNPILQEETPNVSLPPYPPNPLPR